MAQFFSYIEIKYNNLNNQITDWLKTTYNKADMNFDSTSPYGHTINVLKELFQHNIIYLKNTIRVLDIEQTYNKKVIQQVSRISGHSVGRAISATGTLKFRLKQDVDIDKEIKDSTIIINNNTLLKNNSNSLSYVTNLNVDKNIYPISLSATEFYVPIIQGKYESQTFTGDNTFNQSFSVNIPSNAQIENFNFNIKYNGLIVNVKDSKYDMLSGELACYVRSGFNGGIDVFFGSRNNGFIPRTSSIIEVTYLLSNGSEGEILNNMENDWKIIGDVTDGQGNGIKMEDLFNITIETDINFASDGETIEYTKSIIPYVSRNFVLATPKQFIFHLMKLSMFSKVNAFNKLDDNVFSITENVIENSIKKIQSSVNNNDPKQKVLTTLDDFIKLYAKYKTNLNDNYIYLYLIPNIQKYFNDNINYFNIPFDVFYLDYNEQDKVLQYLRQLGTMSMSTEIEIIQPVITRYVMHVYIRKFDYANDENIRQEVISTSSAYLLNNDRFDRIPKSDFIKMFKDIDGVDSASIYFVGEKNEAYHKNAIDLGYTKTPTDKFNDPNESGFKPKIQPILSQPTTIKNGKETVNKAYRDGDLIGIDKVHGDIIMELDEYAIIRGGWSDRNGVYYNENPNENSLNSINIVFNGITKS